MHSRRGVAHEVHDELRERSVEGVVGERQRLGCRKRDLDSRQPRSTGVHEGLRGIDRTNVRVPEPPGESSCEGAGPAAHVERAHSRLDACELDQRRGQRRTVAADVTVVRVGGHTEGLEIRHFDRERSSAGSAPRRVGSTMVIRRSQWPTPATT